jgi:hypothetical protein
MFVWEEQGKRAFHASNYVAMVCDVLRITVYIPLSDVCLSCKDA